MLLMAFAISSLTASSALVTTAFPPLFNEAVSRAEAKEVLAAVRVEWGKRVVERETRWARSEGKEEVMAVTRVSAVLRKESLGREEGGRRVSVFLKEAWAMEEKKKGKRDPV